MRGLGARHEAGGFSVRQEKGEDPAKCADEKEVGDFVGGDEGAESDELERLASVLAMVQSSLEQSSGPETLLAVTELLDLLDLSTTLRNDRSPKMIGRTLSPLQNGVLQSYAASMAGGVILIALLILVLPMLLDLLGGAA